MRHLSFLLLNVLLAACAARTGIEPVPRQGNTKGPGGLVAGAPGKTAGTLEVEFMSPKGQLAERPRQVVVMFNQPMLALGAALSTPSPIVISPEVATRSYWVGTRIAVLVPEDPFPLASRFEIRVPAGVRSASGLALSRDVTAAFETPRPALLNLWPRPGRKDCNPLQPFILLTNQPVDSDRLAQVVSFGLERGGTIPATVSIPSASELKALVRELDVWDFPEAPDGTVFVARPASPLPLDTPFRIHVAEGLVGREGPLPSTVSQDYKYRTYGPLRVVGTGCGAHCSPDEPWEASVEFSNPVSVKEFRQKVLRAGGDEDESDWQTSTHRAVIRPQPGRTYDVVLPADLTDGHGQTLGRDVRLR